MKNRDDDRDRGRRRSPDRSDSELRVLVHESHAGAIIGRGGSRIKELREKSGAQLKVNRPLRVADIFLFDHLVMIINYCLPRKWYR